MQNNAHYCRSMRAAIIHMQSITLYKALKCWQSWVEDKAKCKLKSMSATRFWYDSCLGFAFHKWGKWVAAKIVKRGQVRDMVSSTYFKRQSAMYMDRP